jgi:hypothetical protein
MSEEMNPYKSPRETGRHPVSNALETLLVAVGMTLGAIVAITVIVHYDVNGGPGIALLIFGGVVGGSAFASLASRRN